jgi:hypothetical protein
MKGILPAVPEALENFAHDHNGQRRADFSELRKYFPKVNGARMPGLYTFRFVREEAPKPDDTLILKEQSWRSLSGNAVKVYGFSNGQVVEVTFPDDDQAQRNFARWESQHLDAAATRNVNGQCSALRWVSRNIGLKLEYGTGLRGNDPIHQVANRNNAHHLVVVHDRQMANAVFGHQSHAILDRVRGGHADNLFGENFADFGLFGRFSFERHFPRVIALGNNSDQSPALDHEQRAHVLVGHELDGFEDHRVRGDGINGGTFIINNFADGAGRDHADAFG